MTEQTGTSSRQTNEGFLDGQLLLAMPSMSDPRFHKAVVFVCAHSAEGAMGIVINHRTPNITFRGLIDQLGILPEDDDSAIRLPARDITVYAGGPVDTSRGFVLHSADYFADDSTLSIDDSVSLTATVDILRAIVAGKGPVQSLLALGYAGWGPGQLEHEIQTNGWLVCPADMALVFDEESESRYDKAMAKLGVHPSFLVSGSGNA